MLRHATDAVSPFQGFNHPNSKPRVPGRAGARTFTLGYTRTPATRACTRGGRLREWIGRNIRQIFSHVISLQPFDIDAVRRRAFPLPLYSSTPLLLFSNLFPLKEQPIRACRGFPRPCE